MAGSFKARFQVHDLSEIVNRDQEVIEEASQAQHVTGGIL